MSGPTETQKKDPQACAGCGTHLDESNSAGDGCSFCGRGYVEDAEEAKSNKVAEDLYLKGCELHATHELLSRVEILVLNKIKPFLEELANVSGIEVVFDEQAQRVAEKAEELVAEIDSALPQDDPRDID